MRENIKRYAYFLGVFVILFVFFFKIHPLVPYDGDDWKYLGYARKAIPLWGNWNPTRVFPEILMPLMGYMAAYFIFPINGNYIHSLIISSSLIVSFFIVVYLWRFSKLLQNRFGTSLIGSLEIITLFLAFHFLIFSHSINPVPYLFGMVNLSCVYYYLIPALLNSCLVLYLFEKISIIGDEEKSLEYLTGFLVLCIYLAIFSNLFPNIILVSFVASVLLVKFHWKTFSFSTIKQFMASNKLFFGILFTWLIVLLFEANGGRAHAIGKPLFDLPIRETLKCAWGIFKHINLSVLFFGALSIFCSNLLCRQNQNKNFFDFFFIRAEKLLFLSLIITTIFLVLLCAKVSPDYLGRTDVLFSIVFWFLLSIFINFAYIVKRFPKLLLVLPLFILFFSMEAINKIDLYMDGTMGRISPSICIQIDTDILKQILNADKEGKAKLILHVPKGDNNDNWPHPFYLGNTISTTLRRHAIIHRKIDIKIQPDSNINKRYGIKIP